MRENFEKLKNIQTLLIKYDQIHFNESERKYKDASELMSENSIICFYLNGAWYAYQEQQKIIDQLKQEKLDHVNKLDKMFYSEKV